MPWPIGLVSFGSGLAADSARIRLCITSANEYHTLPPESINNVLLENEALQDLVKGDLVVLKPELGCKRPFVEFLIHVGLFLLSFMDLDVFWRILPT